ncbi:MAG TPA: serine/threonine-protein kinase [Luteitalea sp.]|nr:serine/threonine-protein kinase [Luteitalea sp.]
MTTPAQWARVTALFDEARQRPSSERAAFVEQACTGDTEVRAEVMALLAADRDDDFLEAGASVQPGDLLDADGGRMLADGEMLGPYRIERLLARGGMGVIYVAVDTRLGRTVTLKLLPSSLSRDARARTRLQREAQTAALLRHPHVVSVHALEELGPALAIVAEYVTGPTLREVIERDGPLSRERWLTVARSLAEALAAAHAAAVVHRDVKASNIVMGHDGLRLVDFGIALADVHAAETRVTQAGQFAGTPLALAPEQLEGGVATALSDQFAYGLVLYEAATGRLPFGEGAIATVWARMLRDDATPLGPLAPQLTSGDTALVHRCLSRRPEDRFEAMQAVLDALSGPSPAAERDARTSTTPSSSDAAARLSSPALPVPAPRRWLDVHHAVTAALYIGLLWPGWLIVATLPDRWRGVSHLGLVCLAAFATSLRLHLWFSVRQYPTAVATDRRRLWPLLTAVDLSYAVLLLVVAMAAADVRLVPAVVSAGLAMCLIVASLVIEPATRRADVLAD